MCYPPPTHQQVLDCDGDLACRLAEGIDVSLCELVFSSPHQRQNSERPRAMQERYEADTPDAFSRGYSSTVIVKRASGRAPNDRFQSHKSPHRWTVFARSNNLFLPQEFPASWEIDCIEAKSTRFRAGQGDVHRIAAHHLAYVCSDRPEHFLQFQIGGDAVRQFEEQMQSIILLL